MWWLLGWKAHHGSLAWQGNGIRDSAAAAQLLQQVNFNGLTPLGTNLISKASLLMLPLLPCSMKGSPAPIVLVCHAVLQQMSTCKQMLPLLPR